MKYLKYILGILVIALAATNYFLDTVDLSAIYLLFASGLILILGYEELQKNRKGLGIPLIVIGVFNLIVLVVNLFLN